MSIWKVPKFYNQLFCDCFCESKNCDCLISAERPKGSESNLTRKVESIKYDADFPSQGNNISKALKN